MNHTDTLFLQLAVILGLATGCGYVIKRLKLPLVVAYLLAGLILSLFNIFGTSSSLVLNILPEIGIAFVLFFIGMELDLAELKYLGKPIVFASLGQILISSLAGFIIASLLGFSSDVSLYLGIGLSFSSTIVVVKMLLEKKDLSSLYGKLSVGILLLEDLVAIAILMIMTIQHSLLQAGLQNNYPVLMLIIKGSALFILSLVLSRHLLGRIFTAMARSSELLFLSAVAWCFVFVALSLFLGFSVVIGAFLAGVALANSPFHYEIQGKVKPLRDFFVMLFFVYLGSQVSFAQLGGVVPLIVLFVSYALVVKPLIFLLILGAFGFRKHTLFQTALTLSQVSEFSLIVMIIGVELGVVSQAALTAMAFVGVFSIIFSSVMISSSRKIYSMLSPFISFFEHGKFTHQAENKKSDVILEGHAILVGAHRIGGEIIKFLKKENIPFLVLDFNPAVIENLMNNKVQALYGDLGDPEILEFLNLEKSKLIISTAANLDDNLLLLSEIKRRKVGAVIITRASSIEEAQMLYGQGADYVILPEIVSGDFIAQILRNHWPNMSFFKKRSEIELNKLARNYLVFK